MTYLLFITVRSCLTGVKNQLLLRLQRHMHFVETAINHRFGRWGRFGPTLLQDHPSETGNKAVAAERPFFELHTGPVHAENV